jgi:hypothetical protein
MGEPTMRNLVDIHSRHSREIVKEIGEQLRALLKEDRELPANLQKQIERLQQSELAASNLISRRRMSKSGLC